MYSGYIRVVSRRDPVPAHVGTPCTASILIRSFEMVMMPPRLAAPPSPPYARPCSTNNIPRPFCPQYSWIHGLVFQHIHCSNRPLGGALDAAFDAFDMSSARAASGHHLGTLSAANGVPNCTFCQSTERRFFSIPLSVCTVNTGLFSFIFLGIPFNINLACQIAIKSILHVSFYDYLSKAIQ